jgi:cold shock CspA family protein
MRVFAPVLFAVLALSLSTGVSSQPSTPANVVCFQEIVGSNSNYAAVSASIAAWAGKLQSALSLSGDVHTYVDWAQVPDRNSFENGCDGPYATVADVFVHIQATGDNFDTLSAELEAFVAANPWTAQPNIACGARSVVTYLPGCGKVPTPPPTAAPTQANNPTQSGPTTPPATSAPTRANNPTSPPAPANVVCYQAIVGSSATQAQVETSIAAWAALLESSLGLSGDVHQFADWALVPDRTSFENGCNGPYSTVEDVFVHIQTTADNFASVSAQLEAFVAAHPITDQPNIACAARSVTTFLPTCGQAPTQAPTRANNPTQAPTQAPTKAPTQAPTKAPTQAPTKAPTEAPTQAPTRANNPTQAPTGSPSRLCYQEIIGSNSDFGTVQSSIGAWAAKLETALGLSGDIHQFVDWSQVTDRNSFEGCAGPYSTVADVFVHVDTTSDAYDALSAKLEAFVAANPWTSQPNIACAARSVVTFIPGCGKTPAGTEAPTRANSPTQAPTQNSTSAPTNSSTPTRANNPTQAPGSPTELPSPNNILCYQEIVGSNSNYTAVSASIGAWAAKLEAALGLSGDVHQYVDWAQVTDRNSFEGGCNGPYTTVADVFVHIDTTSQAFDGLSAQLEAFVAANPWNSQPSIACGARSVVTYIPGCGKLQTGPNPAATTAPPATQAPTSAPTTAGTTAPTTAPTSAPTTAGTSAPTSTSAPIPTSGPSSAPTPANVVCYQAVFGSNSNFSVVSADVAAWAA